MTGGTGRAVKCPLPGQAEIAFFVAMSPSAFLSAPWPPAVVMVGAGRLASQLAPALARAGCPVTAVWSRSAAAATALAGRLPAARATTSLHFADLPPGALLLLAVPDDAIAPVAARLRVAPHVTVAHTSGSVSLEVLRDLHPSAGVFYPVQTFSAGRTADWQHVPLLVEGSDARTGAQLATLARRLSHHVHAVDSARRRQLHLAAVFAGNFTNHLLTVAETLCQTAALDFAWLQPLVRETIDKALTLGPAAAQTGPARRRDADVLAAHAAMLAPRPDLQSLYQLISDGIARADGPSPQPAPDEALRAVRAFVFDVDGVFTNGDVLALDDGAQARTFNTKDGVAVSRAVRAGYALAVISGGNQEGVRRRLAHLKVPHIYLGADDKRAVFTELLATLGLTASQVLYMGDDLPDLPVLTFPGVLSACPADAVAEVKQHCRYVSPCRGGAGAVRDVIERTLRVQGQWLPNDLDALNRH